MKLFVLFLLFVFSISHAQQRTEKSYRPKYIHTSDSDTSTQTAMDVSNPTTQKTNTIDAQAENNLYVRRIANATETIATCHVISLLLGVVGAIVVIVGI